MIRCSRCGREFRAPLSARGQCATCAAPLCFYCVAVDQARYCADHQPQDVPDGPRVACAVCGKWPLGPRDSGLCRHEGCGERLCLECLALGARTCPEHAPAQSEARVPTPSGTVAGGPAPEPPAICGYCGRTILAGEAHQTCAVEGCAERLCCRCTELGEAHCGRHLLHHGLRTAARHQPACEPSAVSPQPPVVLHPVASCPAPQPADDAGAETIAEAFVADTPEAAPDTDAPITGAIQARAACASFLTRFRAAMAEPRALTLGFDGSQVWLPGWAEPTRVQTGDAELAALSLLVSAPVCQPEVCPANAAQVYELAPRSWAGLGRPKRALAIEARCLVRPERYLRAGGDWQPIGAEGTLALLEKLSREAEQGGYFRLVCLFSPTGWDEDTTGLVATAPASRRLILPNLKVVLAGPEGDRFCFNADDPRAAELDALFPLVLVGERTALLMAQINALLADRDGLMIDEVTQCCGCSEAEARAAFERLAADARLEVLDLPRRPMMIAHRR